MPRTLGKPNALKLLGTLAFCLLLHSLWTLPTQAQGGVILMNIDAEDGGPNSHGPIQSYEDALQRLQRCVTNGARDVLVIGAGKSANDHVTSFWTQIKSDLSLDMTFVHGDAGIKNQSFAGFGVIAVVSDASQVANGGLTQQEHDALVQRSGDVAAFVNGGGTLLGFLSSFSDPFGYIQGLGAITVDNSVPQFSDIDPLPEGLATGVTNALDVGYWHGIFLTHPPFLDVLATRGGTSDPAAIGGCRVRVPEKCGGPCCLGACCLDSGCIETTSTYCEQSGGSFHGEGVGCEIGNCLLGEICYPTTENACKQKGGTYLGVEGKCPMTINR